MGNCFGKPSDKNFQGEGRTVGGASSSAAAPKNYGSIPNGKISTPQSGRTLGKNPQAPGDSASPREAAAKAAEERAKASSANQGKLGKQLAEQRARTQSETLAQTARENIAARDADASAEARNWN